MPSSQTSILLPADAPGNLPRFLRWTGLALVCMVVGVAIGVWGLGPRMMGSALGQSRFHSLNNQIRGVLEHDSCDLHWTTPGRVHGLRLADKDGAPLVRGELVIPALSSHHWTDGVLPQNVGLELDEMVLRIDSRGECSLLERLSPRSEHG
ncbi:MAG: hypothetical protein KDB61_12225, partial [Planctomycetes bacterium]|nr:hypothetical protein [Planctomycetota bacterium]